MVDRKVEEQPRRPLDQLQFASAVPIDLATVGNRLACFDPLAMTHADLVLRRRRANKRVAGCHGDIMWNIIVYIKRGDAFAMEMGRLRRPCDG